MESPILGNLLASDTEPETGESSEVLVEGPGFLLERIVSRGAASPEGFWYDQARPEWVALLRGRAELRFEGGEVFPLSAGDHLLIPAGCRHRVEHASADAIWLALHHGPEIA